MSDLGSTSTEASSGVPAAARIDREEFGRLLASAYPSLVLVASSEVGSSSAEDVVQDAAAAAAVRLDRFEAGTDFVAWLSAFVRNAARNHRRREQRKHTMLGLFGRSGLVHEASDREPAGSPGSPGAGRRPGSGAASVEVETGFERAVQAAVERLTPVQRSCFLLRVVMEHGYAEIGEMLGIPESTARSHVYRARRGLAEWLTEEDLRGVGGVRADGDGGASDG